MGHTCPEVTSLIDLLMALRNSTPTPTSTLLLTLSPRWRGRLVLLEIAGDVGDPRCVVVDRGQAHLCKAHPGSTQLRMDVGV